MYVIIFSLFYASVLVNSSLFSTIVAIFTERNPYSIILTRKKKTKKKKTMEYDISKNTLLEFISILRELWFLCMLSSLNVSLVCSQVKVINHDDNDDICILYGRLSTGARNRVIPARHHKT